MNKKWTSILLIGILFITGFIVLYPNNFLDLKIITLGLGENESVYKFFYYLTFFGSRIILIPFVIIGSGYLYIKFKNYRPSLIFISGTLLSYLLNVLIKYLVKRVRPSIIEEVYGAGYSFPSGHAMISTVCYGIFLFYLLKVIKKKRTRKLLVISIGLLLLLIGYSRIVLGVHYFTDILGGYLIGLLFIIFYLKINKQVITKNLS